MILEPQKHFLKWTQYLIVIVVDSKISDNFDDLMKQFLLVNVRTVQEQVAGDVSQL